MGSEGVLEECPIRDTRAAARVWRRVGRARAAMMMMRCETPATLEQCCDEYVSGWLVPFVFIYS
jgi:hypothetical protein